MHAQSETHTRIFIQAYRSFLTAEGEMSVDQIVRLYCQMKPSIHKKAASKEVDIEAFMYSFMRLPRGVHEVSRVVMAQTEERFVQNGYDVKNWHPVSAPARRRKMFTDKNDQIAMTINSVTDLDDVVCLLTAFQIEWNKMHELLQKCSGENLKDDGHIQHLFGVDNENWARIRMIWGADLHFWIETIMQRSLDFRIKLLRGAYVDYKKAAQQWFENICAHTRYQDLRNRPLYFVSSNTHSLVNNMTGWVNSLEKELVHFIQDNTLHELAAYWDQIRSGEHPGSKENFLWYVLKKYEKSNPSVRSNRMSYEKKMGIDFIEAEHFLDIDAQVMEVYTLEKTGFLQKTGMESGRIAQSDALILNIDYPLGFGAYMVMSTILQNVQQVKGVYILGKASFLHGSIGDIAIPHTVLDTYSESNIIFRNAFDRTYFNEYRGGSVLTNQKVVSSKGTFLHPWESLQEYFLDDYTIIEMENGPYLNALYENTHYDRYPTHETVNMLGSPVDIGIIHYASDTPFTKAVTLGTRNLGYDGVEATYASSLAILKRIIDMELSSR